MSKRIDAWFVLFGVVCLLAGMILGEVMGGSGDHSQQPTHAHMNLAGGVLAIVFGLSYRAWPVMKGALSIAHLLLHMIGLVVMEVGLFLMFGGMGETTVPVLGATIGSMMILLGLLVFLFNFATKALKAD